MIKLQFINYHVIIRRKHLRLLLYDCWKSIDPANCSLLDDDHFISKQFLKDFCKKHGLSFRMMKKKKRSEINLDDVRRYIRQIIKIFRQYDKSLIFNMDETAWNFVYKTGKVLAKSGQ